MDISDLRKKLKTLRDELELQIHLGSKDAQQEWEALESKWIDFASRTGLDETAEDVGSALDLLGKSPHAQWHVPEHADHLHELSG